MAAGDLIGVRGKVLKHMCILTGIKREFMRNGKNFDWRDKFQGSSLLLPFATHTKSHQLPFDSYWNVFSDSIQITLCKYILSSLHRPSIGFRYCIVLMGWSLLPNALWPFDMITSCKSMNADYMYEKVSRSAHVPPNSATFDCCYG